MRRDVTKLLQNEFDEFDDLFSDLEVASSFYQLARIYCLITTDSKVTKRVSCQWLEKIKQSLTQYKDYSPIEQRLESNAERAIRVLSHGEIFNDDELLLVLTLLIEIEFDLMLLSETGVGLNYNLRLDDIHSDLDEIKNSSENKGAYFSALAMLQKNNQFFQYSRYFS